MDDTQTVVDGASVAPAPTPVPPAPDFSTLPVDAQISALKSTLDNSASLVAAMASHIAAQDARIDALEAKPSETDVSDVRDKVARLLRHIFGE